MVNVTISLSEETVQRLRKAVRELYSGKKGALSGLIEESIREKLDVSEMSSPSRSFKAMKGNRVIAEGENLDNLATKLKEMKVDPRSARIISSEKLAPIVRAGLRGRKL